MNTITIGGFMATGKTTVGKQLAEQLARPFVDLDVLIEQTTTQLLDFNQEDHFVLMLFMDQVERTVRYNLYWKRIIFPTLILE